jgi:urease accessory protein
MDDFFLRQRCHVMAGLVPAIHALRWSMETRKDVDARHKAGHDGGGAVRRVAVVLWLLWQTHSPALAHTGSVTGGFAGGLSHPLFGPDHVAAMVAVGLWGAFLGPPAMFILPVVFPVVMAFGGVLGILGVPLPGLEIGIAISAAVLGMMVALAARPPLWVAAILVGAFAIFHGYAHGTELPPGADAMAFSAGFVIATGCLHLCGIAFGQLARWPAGRIAVRAAGGVIAMAGLVFLGRLV